MEKQAIQNLPWSHLHLQATSCDVSFEPPPPPEENDDRRPSNCPPAGVTTAGDSAPSGEQLVKFTECLCANEDGDMVAPAASGSYIWGGTSLEDPKDPRNRHNTAFSFECDESDESEDEEPLMMPERESERRHREFLLRTERDAVQAGEDKANRPDSRTFELQVKGAVGSFDVESRERDLMSASDGRGSSENPHAMKWGPRGIDVGKTPAPEWESESFGQSSPAIRANSFYDRQSSSAVAESHVDDNQARLRQEDRSQDDDSSADDEKTPTPREDAIETGTIDIESQLLLSDPDEYVVTSGEAAPSGGIIFCALQNRKRARSGAQDDSLSRPEKRASSVALDYRLMHGKLPTTRRFEPTVEPSKEGIRNFCTSYLDWLCSALPSN